MPEPDARAVLQLAIDLIDREASRATGDWQAYFTVHGDPMIVPTARPWPASRIADISTAPADYGLANCVLIGASGPQHWRAVADLFRAVLQAHPDAGMLSAGYCGTCAVPTDRCATLAAVLPLAQQTIDGLTGRGAEGGRLSDVIPTTPEENR